MTEPGIGNEVTCVATAASGNIRAFPLQISEPHLKKKKKKNTASGIFKNSTASNLNIFFIIPYSSVTLQIFVEDKKHDLPKSPKKA